MSRSKKNKGRRKVRVLKGTIFDRKPKFRSPMQHRRVGFWFMHNIDPMAVQARGIWVERYNKDEVLVHYRAVVIGDRDKDIPRVGMGQPGRVPAGISCSHGEKPGIAHTATQWTFVRVPKREVVR